MDTEKALNRAYFRWLEDGLAEIWFGIVMAAIGALRAVIHLVGNSSPYWGWLVAILFTVMFGYGAGAKHLTKIIKSRISYRRTGYMTIKHPTFKVWQIVALLVAAGLLGAGVGIIAVRPDERQVGEVVPILMGMMWAVAYLYVAFRIKVKCFFYLGVFSSGIGLIIGGLTIGTVLGLSAYYFSMGVGLIVSGSIGLMGFLRRYEPVNLNRENQ